MPRALAWAMCPSGSLWMLVLFSFITTGCKEEPDAAPDDELAPAAAAREPTTKARPKQKSQTPDERKSDDSADASADSVELTWFHGVAELPAAHPCHDSTPIISAEEHREVVDGEAKLQTDSERMTLGEARDRFGTDWVHFGPRTARGVRWKTDAGQFLVATCNMGGMGYRLIDEDTYLDDIDVDTTGAEFIIGRVGEPSNVEYGDLRWMHREGDGPWKTLHEEVLWSSGDEGNHPEHVARARIISAEDSDGDETPEVVAIVLSNRFEWNKSERKKLCPPIKGRYYHCDAFGIDVVVREGDQQVVERSFMGLSGEPVLTRDAKRPGSMDDETLELLTARLERDRDKALQKARAILRETEKLQ